MVSGTGWFVVTAHFGVARSAGRLHAELNGESPMRKARWCCGLTEHVEVASIRFALAYAVPLLMAAQCSRLSLAVDS